MKRCLIPVAALLALPPSVHGEEAKSGGDLSFLELKLPVSLKLTDAWSASVTYVPRWNFKDSRDRHRLETAATLNWGASREFAWSTGAEIPLSSQSFEWKVVSGFTWYFN